MQPENRDAAYLWDMLDAAREVSGMIAGASLSDFVQNVVLLRATERSIEIIGEAAGRVSQSFRDVHPDIPWHQIIGQRHILAHEYGRIDNEMLFRTATEDIPQLIGQVETLLPPAE